MKPLVIWTLVVLAVLPFLVEPIQLRRIASLLVLCLAVLGVVVATGYTGLISLGHGAFVGLGAFTMGYLVDQFSIPFLVALALTFAWCSLVGAGIGLPVLRIRGIYLALVTLGIGVVFPALARQFPAASGGVTGRRVESEWNPPPWTGLDATNDAILWRYLLCVGVCGAMFWLTNRYLGGRAGRAMQAIRDDETAAVSFGVNPVVVKTTAFGLSAGLAGLSGALQAILFPFVSHTQFTVFLSFRLYAGAIVGGVAVVAGAVYGVAALAIVPLVTGALGLLENDILVFGLALIVLTYASPDGMAGIVSRFGPRPELGALWRKLRSRYTV